MFVFQKSTSPHIKAILDLSLSETKKTISNSYCFSAPRSFEGRSVKTISRELWDSTHCAVAFVASEGKDQINKECEKLSGIFSCQICQAKLEGFGLT